MSPAPRPLPVHRSPPLRNRGPRLLETCLIATSYVTIYLGLAKLIMWSISRFGEVRLATRVAGEPDA